MSETSAGFFGVSPQYRSEHKRWWRLLEKRTERLLKQCWPMVEAVAHALLKERTLSGARVRQIMREATPKGLDVRALRAEATALTMRDE